MVSKIKVGIVEDEMIIAQGLVQALTELGYDTTEPAISYTEALGMIVDEKPDILLVDIVLKGSKDGIDLAQKVRQDFNIPFIFLTANSDAATMDRAKKTFPPAFLVKPFSKTTLYTSIEICLNNFSTADQQGSKEATDLVVKDHIFVKQGNVFLKVRIDDVRYIESHDVYVYLHTATEKLLVRGSLQNYIDQLGPARFLRVHKGYAVNIRYIDAVDANAVTIDKVSLPIGRAYRDDLTGRLGLK
jgi:DNA-binding LytR/AlgR family response regulator